MKLKFFLLVLLFFCITGCKEKIYTKIPEEVNINYSSDVFSVYQDIKLSDILIEPNFEFYNIDLDTSDLGNKDIDFIFTYNKKKYKYTYHYQIVDQESPKIFGSGNKTVLINYKKDICDLVTYGDNFDREPQCEIIGEYDLDQVGIYNIIINVVDSSGNEANHNLKLNVVNNIDNTSKSNSSKLSFTDAYNTYKNDNNELGIDVSKWQGDIDFQKVKEAGATFVMIRLGVKLNSGEEPNLDSYFLQNIKNAKEAGLKVGVYLYSKALTTDEARNEANWVLNALGSEQLDLPVVFDWEIWSGWNTYHLSFHDINEIAKSFINTIESHGYKGMLYGSKFYLENFWDNTFDNIWLAHYTSKTSFEGYKIWQFSNVGRIAGINGDVDLDLMTK